MTIAVDWNLKPQTKHLEQSDLGPFCLQYRLLEYSSSSAKCALVAFMANKNPDQTASFGAV